MLNRFKSVVSNVMGGLPAIPHQTEIPEDPNSLQVKFHYNRPDFLFLTSDEVELTADHISRPILVPRCVNKLPWKAGYAEVINAGKSKSNEDQATAMHFHIMPHMTETLLNKTDNQVEMTDMANTECEFDNSLEYTYFAIFDGHAGTGAALMASNTLHKHIQERLLEVKDLLLCSNEDKMNDILKKRNMSANVNLPTKRITKDCLVKGALETAFCDMDEQIARERTTFRIKGGCTALVALFFGGKLYVANAGDCRAVIYRGEEIIPMSTDFTPVSERKRIAYLGYLQPELLHNEFTHLEFQKRVHRRDIGKKILCRDALMDGWFYKTVEEQDLKYPLIYGEGKRTRVLATIGVTRGFGDHDLKVHSSDIHIKPFLSPVPEVQVYDMTSCEHTEDDILVMGSDGLWDVMTNQDTGRIVREDLRKFSQNEDSRYTSAAQELVSKARGHLHPKGRGWRMENDRPSSGDDITAFIIPLSQHNSPSCSINTQNGHIPEKLENG